MSSRRLGNVSAISLACNHKLDEAGGFRWRFVGDHWYDERVDGQLRPKKVMGATPVWRGGKQMWQAQLSHKVRLRLF